MSSSPNDPRATPPRGTQPVKPYDPSARLTPPATTGHVQAQRGGRDKRKRGKPTRRSSGLYLPAWSVLLTLVIVVAAAGGVIALVVLMGGNQPAPTEPQIRIVTAIPSDTPLPSEPTAIPEGAQPIATVPFGVPTTTSAIPLPQFALEGPTLPPVILSPTPLRVGIGVTVVTTDDANVRSGPGTNNAVLFTTRTGTAFTVIDGPQQGAVANTTGTWWRVQNVSDPSQTGWVFEELLIVRQ